jgi:hypothetical protein
MLPLIARVGAQILAKSAQAGARTAQVANVGGQAASRGAQAAEAGSAAANAAKSAGQAVQNSPALKERLVYDQLRSEMQKFNQSFAKETTRAFEKLNHDALIQKTRDGMKNSDAARRSAEAIKQYL